MWNEAWTTRRIPVDNLMSSTEQHQRHPNSGDVWGCGCGDKSVVYPGGIGGYPQSTAPTTTTNLIYQPSVRGVTL